MPRSHWPTFEELLEKDDQTRCRHAQEWFRRKWREFLLADGVVTWKTEEGLRSAAAAKFNVPKHIFVEIAGKLGEEKP